MCRAEDQREIPNDLSDIKPFTRLQLSPLQYYIHQRKWHMTKTELMKNLLIVVIQASNKQHTIHALLRLAEPRFFFFFV